MKFTGERFVPDVEGWIALQHYHRYYFVLDQIDISGKVILDIACGEGFGSKIISKSSKFVYGVDISKDVIENAKKSYHIPNLEFLVGNATSIPLNDQTIDVVISFETIEHLELHNEMMKEIKRVLKPDGTLVISSPDKGYYEKNLPQNNNQYHIKELYHGEFNTLITKYFKCAEFFIQNNVIGSIIAKEYESGKYMRPYQIEKGNGFVQTIEPRFNLCIASDNEISFSNSISICTPTIDHDIYSEFDSLKNTIIEQERLIENIHSSVFWKIRELLFKPLRKIKHSLR
jgi:ubiquinone/menaquinone biosynthesis C-methylase UbiE